MFHTCKYPKFSEHKTLFFFQQYCYLAPLSVFAFFLFIWSSNQRTAKALPRDRVQEERDHLYVQWEPIQICQKNLINETQVADNIFLLNKILTYYKNMAKINICNILCTLYTNCAITIIIFFRRLSFIFN